MTERSQKCTFDPMTYAGLPIGMFHCPECGEMVLAGLPHPDYDEEIPLDTNTDYADASNSK